MHVECCKLRSDRKLSSRELVAHCRESYLWGPNRNVPHTPAQGCTARNGTERHGTARHGTARHTSPGSEWALSCGLDQSWSWYAPICQPTNLHYVPPLLASTSAPWLQGIDKTSPSSLQLLTCRAEADWLLPACLPCLPRLASACLGLPWLALACLGLPWLALACLGMPWHGWAWQSGMLAVDGRLRTSQAGLPAGWFASRLACGLPGSGSLMPHKLR